jgi:hypothetical protein
MSNGAAEFLTVGEISAPPEKFQSSTDGKSEQNEEMNFGDLTLNTFIPCL